MADKKISQFPTFDGTADSEVFFVVASGETDDPNAANYRFPFPNLTQNIIQAGSAWSTGIDIIYTLTGAVGLGTTAPIYQLDVATTGRFRDDLIVSGDLFVSGTTHIQKIIDASITGTISGVTGEFADGIFADSLTISGVSVATGGGGSTYTAGTGLTLVGTEFNTAGTGAFTQVSGESGVFTDTLTISGVPVSTGGSLAVPGGGGSVVGGDDTNINFGGTEPSDTREVNFQVGGADKLVIGSDGNVSIAEDLTVSGNLAVSGNITGAIISGASGIFSHSLTISGVPVSTGGSLSVPGGGGSVVGGDDTNINFGGTDPSDTREVNFQVGGADKLVIGSDGNTSIAEDLTVSGNLAVSGNITGAIISGASGIFSHSLTISGVPVATGVGGGGGGSTYTAGTGLTLVGTEFNTAGTGAFTQVSGESGVFTDTLTISGVPVSTGGSLAVPGGGGSVVGGDDTNINFGGTEPSDTREVNFQVGGADKLVIGSDGNTSIAEDLTVSGNLAVSGNITGAIISGASGIFSHSLTISGVPVATGVGGGGGGSTYTAGTGLTLVGTEFNTAGTGAFTQVSGESGVFTDTLTISGVPVSTGGSLAVPGGGGSVVGGDDTNINFGGTEPSDTREVNFQVGGADKLVIGSDGNTSIAEDLTVSGNLAVSGNITGAIISGASGIFSHSLTISGVSVATGVGGGGGGTPGGADTNIQFNEGGSFGGSNYLTYDYNSELLSGASGIFDYFSGHTGYFREGHWGEEVIVGTGSDVALIANDAGNVGVGWSGTPTEPIAAQLHVSGSTIISGSSEITLDYDRLPKSNPDIKGRVWIHEVSGLFMVSSGIAPDPDVPPIIIIQPMRMVSAGEQYSLFLTTAGNVYACGRNGYGQLGDDSSVDKDVPTHITGDVTGISAGAEHSMFLSTGGDAYACGHNSQGGLGDGTTVDKDVPTHITGDVSGISAGDLHSMFLSTGGDSYACGYNNYGQLGDGTIVNKDVPTHITGDVTGISAGRSQSMFLSTGGDSYACGYNNHGQLGDGTTDDKYVPTHITGDVLGIAAGMDNSMFLSTGGDSYACGSNGYGKLGDGTTVNKYVPTHITGDVTGISAGNLHSMFLSTAGDSYACGFNVEGQLGDGTAATKYVPTHITGDVTGISAGGNHSMFFSTGKDYYACGQNFYGQLGDGTTEDKDVPTYISGQGA